MAKPPRRPRAVALEARIEQPRRPGPIIAPQPSDVRQPDFFRPGFIAPCKPLLRDKLPVGPFWRYEVKHDGYRIQAHSIGGDAQLFTKGGHDWTPRMPAIRDALTDLGRNVVLDGEAVIIGQDGIADFFALHGALARKSAPDAIFLAFDVLWIDGDDVRDRPLSDRVVMLEELLSEPEAAIQLVGAVDGSGATILRQACGMGLEGIVAKRMDRPYRSGDREEWIKVRCTRVDHFAVVGFKPAGRAGLSSLKLAKLVDGALVPCGWAGSGITENGSRELRHALDAGRLGVAEIEHRGGTPAGELRHPVVRGWSIGE